MYYRQPKYFAGFHCIGGACPENCCYGWSIDWKREEIDKILNAENLSDGLRELTEKSFFQRNKDENKFSVVFGEDGKCPFQTEDNLCIIQKELGPEYLSHTCKNYPRINIYAGSTVYRFARMSCPAVMNELLNDESSMSLFSENIPNGKMLYYVNKIKNVEKYPIQKYRSEIFEFFYEIISDKKVDVDGAVILGALAASALTKLEQREEYDSIPEQLKSLRKQTHDGKMLQSLDNIKPNPRLKFDFITKITEGITKQSATVLMHNPDGTLNTELYAIGEQRLKEALAGREYFLRNVALSLLFELDVPFKLPERTIFENYSLFVSAYACVKLNLIAAMSTKMSINMHTYEQKFHYEDGDSKLTGLTALICRVLCQNSGNSGMIIDMIKEKGYDRAAYLALFVK